MDQATIRLFHQLLMTVDVTTFRPGDALRTEQTRELEGRSRSAVVWFLQDLAQRPASRQHSNAAYQSQLETFEFAIEQDATPSDTTNVAKTRLFGAFSAFCALPGVPSHNLNQTQLISALREVIPDSFGNTTVREPGHANPVTAACVPSAERIRTALEARNEWSDIQDIQ